MTRDVKYASFLLHRIYILPTEPSSFQKVAARDLLSTWYPLIFFFAFPQLPTSLCSSGWLQTQSLTMRAALDIMAVEEGFRRVDVCVARPGSEIDVPGIVSEKNGTARNGAEYCVVSNRLTSRNLFSHSYTCDFYYIASNARIYL